MLRLLLLWIFLAALVLGDSGSASRDRWKVFKRKACQRASSASTTTTTVFLTVTKTVETEATETTPIVYTTVTKSVCCRGQGPAARDSPEDAEIAEGLERIISCSQK